MVKLRVAGGMGAGEGTHLIAAHCSAGSSGLLPGAAFRFLSDAAAVVMENPGFDPGASSLLTTCSSD